MTTALATKVCLTHDHQHLFLACKMYLSFLFYTLFLQLNEFQYEWQCSSCAIAPIFCQHAKLQFLVMVSTGRCLSPVNAPRCNRMRNLSHFHRIGWEEQKCWDGKIASRNRREPGSGYHCLWHFVQASSRQLSHRTVCLVTCKVCLYIWHLGASAYKSKAYLLKHHVSDVDIPAQRL